MIPREVGLPDIWACLIQYSSDFREDLLGLGSGGYERRTMVWFVQDGWEFRGCVEGHKFFGCRGEVDNPGNLADDLLGIT